MIILKNNNRWKYILLTIIIIVIAWSLWPVKNAFTCSYSRVLFDSKGKLLQVILANDQQLRFPLSGDSLPEKYVKAVVCWEDHRFFFHPGVDLLSIVQSFFVNLKAGKRIRGASTITMQTVRLANPHKRTYFRKVVECLSAFRYTLHLSKYELLKLYASHVPMGGNTVGIESASYRYFGTSLKEITWAQAALFAVLPNSPSMINIERRRPLLKEKRDRLLHKLLIQKSIDSLTYRGACAELLPEPVSRIPFLAPHFARYCYTQTPSAVIHSTLDVAMQSRAENIMRSFHARLKSEGIRNCAVLVAETKTGAIRVYIGSQSFFDSSGSGQVDGIQAARSSGSILKPFLAAKAIDRGPWNIQSTLHDVPTWYGNFTPMNSDQQFSGLVTIEQMLIRSLNIPAVRLLHAYSVDDFYNFLKRDAAFSSLTRSSSEYGLSLILGGAEVTLWKCGALYCTLGNLGGYTGLSVVEKEAAKGQQIISRGASWITLEAIKEVKRPDIEFYRQYFSEQIPVAWKTGTSYGQKDAWAIGVNAQWTIGVWAGNFNGEGNQLLNGSKSAGPLLFSLFRNFTDMKKQLWFEKPEIDLKVIDICSESGFLPTEFCQKRQKVNIPECSYVTKTCTLHRRFCSSKKTGYEVCSQCWNISDTQWTTATMYDPSVVAIYRKTGHAMDAVPVHNPHCKTFSSQSRVEIEYPLDGHTIQVPMNFNGQYEKIILKANYQRKSGRLFWYLNNAFLGETIDEHSVAVDLTSGDYLVTVQDEGGSKAEVRFKAFRKYHQNSLKT